VKVICSMKTVRKVKSPESKIKFQCVSVLHVKVAKLYKYKQKLSLLSEKLVPISTLHCSENV
jgi:hypothetical protein